MNTYFSTFTTGFSDVIKEVLPKILDDFTIELIKDGLIIYKTSSPIERIKSVPYFNNSFLVIKYFPKLEANPIKQMFKQVLNDPGLENVISKSISKKRTTFRIIAKDEQMVSVDKNILTNLERKLSRINNLVVDRTLPQIEFWFMIRREGYGLFGLRLTKRPNYEKTLEKGELYPEFAAILCLLSEPSREDIFLDPFCGYGSIPMQRVKNFPYKQVLASDIDPKLTNRLGDKVKKMGKKIVVGRWDAQDLRTFENNSVDKIVTDPPWGLHSGTNLNIDNLYKRMLLEFSRVLKQNGILVVLTANKELFDELLHTSRENFMLIAKYDTLVSGRKAGVYKIQKV